MGFVFGNYCRGTTVGIEYCLSLSSHIWYNQCACIQYVYKCAMSPIVPRYEKMAEQEEVNYQQLRRKLFREV